MSLRKLGSDFFSKNKHRIQSFKADPWLLAYEKIEYARIGVAFASVATLHAVGFCLNLKKTLWSLIDFSLLASITFSFALVISLSFFALRGFYYIWHVSVFMYVALLFSIVEVMTFIVNAHRLNVYFRWRKIGMKNAPGKFFKNNFFLVFVSMLGIPSLNRIYKFRAIINNISLRFMKLGRWVSYGISLALFSSLYAGWYFTGLIAAVLYFSIVATIFAWPTFEVDIKNAYRKAKVLGFPKEKTIAITVLKLDNDSRKKVFSLILVVLSAVALATGHLRFNYLQSRPAITMTVEEKEITGTPIIASSTAFFVSLTSGEQIAISTASTVLFNFAKE